MFLLLPVVVLLLLLLEDKDSLDCLVEDERVLSRCCGCGCACGWLGVFFLTDKRHEGNVDVVEVVVVAVVVGTNGSDDVDGNDIIIFSPSPPSTIIR